MSGEDNKFIALGIRLRGIPEVTTLGVKPNFLDYTPGQRELILESEPILFPTRNYAQFLTTMGKRIFPSLETYLYADEKIKQTTLFYMLGIPHPRTRIYHRLHHGDILKDFQFPFIGKLPRRSACGRGVFLLQNQEELTRYLSLTQVAYIQNYLPHEKDLRVVLIKYQPVAAYWRFHRPDEFRTNLSQGGEIRFDPVPTEALKSAAAFAEKCKFDDVGLDMIQSHGKWFLIEANMMYGRRGLTMKGLDLKEIMREKLLTGQI